MGQTEILQRPVQGVTGNDHVPYAGPAPGSYNPGYGRVAQSDGWPYERGPNYRINQYAEYVSRLLMNTYHNAAVWDSRRHKGLPPSIGYDVYSEQLALNIPRNPSYDSAQGDRVGAGGLNFTPIE